MPTFKTEVKLSINLWAGKINLLGGLTTLTLAKLNLLFFLDTTIMKNFFFLQNTGQIEIKSYLTSQKDWGPKIAGTVCNVHIGYEYRSKGLRMK